MLTVVGCITNAHDPVLVSWAAIVCLLASIATISLLRRARVGSMRARIGWLASAAAAGGSGIWSTHFLAMLAFSSGMPSGYRLGTTILSLTMAIVVTFFGFLVAVFGERRWAPPLGGAIVGAGIGAMHFTGMAAYAVAGQIVWDHAGVVAAIVTGTVFSSLAFAVAVAGTTVATELLAALILIIAICGLHFTAMSAITIVPDPRVVIPAVLTPGSWVGAAVIMAMAIILAASCALLLLDMREKRRETEEAERTRSLVNATAEALLICADGHIVDANDNAGILSGRALGDLIGLPVGAILVGKAIDRALAALSSETAEGELRGRDGLMVPVEMVARSVIFARAPHVAVAVRDISARRRAERQIQYLAHHDPLTGLLNRESFNHRIDESLELTRVTGRKLAILCLDLDRFKEVNDLFGHPAGDSMLQTVARVVSETFVGGEIMARLGGDEFAVAAIVDHGATAGTLAERILAALRAATSASAAPMISTSIGIAVYPTDGEDRQTLLSHADTALYRAKSDGRGTYCYFEARMGTEVRARRLLEHDLRQAVARGQLRIVYQPQWELANDEITGFEALLRWEHPERGLVAPSLFIPLAEETGLIGGIGEWVLRNACREAANWENPLIVAVNVSAVQLHAAPFPQLVKTILDETGLPPARLELEITETALIRDPARALATLRRLKEMGMRIAMDDFGTGYSSLSNLRMFPFDKLKIDRSFIASVEANDQTAAIVRSVLGLGRGLGIPVLAEGVETEAEMAFLRGEACFGAQGYLISRPAPIDDFASLTGFAETAPPQDEAA